MSIPYIKVLFVKYYLWCQLFSFLTTFFLILNIYVYKYDDVLYVVQLSDMRYSKRMDGTKSFTICGDPFFFAPEIIRQQGKVEKYRIIELIHFLLHFLSIPKEKIFIFLLFNFFLYALISSYLLSHFLFLFILICNFLSYAIPFLSFLHLSLIPPFPFFPCSSFFSSSFITLIVIRFSFFFFWLLYFIIFKIIFYPFSLTSFIHSFINLFLFLLLSLLLYFFSIFSRL